MERKVGAYSPTTICKLIVPFLALTATILLALTFGNLIEEDTREVEVISTWSALKGHKQRLEEHFYARYRDTDTGVYFDTEVPGWVFKNHQNDKPGTKILHVARPAEYLYGGNYSRENFARAGLVLCGIITIITFVWAFYVVCDQYVEYE